MSQINTNRGFVDMRNEPVWGDEGADLAAGDQLDIASATGGETVANLVQPNVPSPLRLTITDVDTSISAFQVDVVGTYNGIAVAQQWVFSGGLIQLGTAIFDVLTSVTCGQRCG
jgi:hypothetical protein